ncbi:MAG: ATP-binding cassette domain-containing protein [Nitrososphaerota archaeon]
MIELKRVSFAYANEDIIRDVNLTFGPGVTVVIGPNGSGKTTLLKLAAAIYRPRVGEVLIDGVNTWSAPETVRVSVRRNVVYVHEKPIMLRGSVADNVAYGLRIRNVPDDEVATRTEEALEALERDHEFLLKGDVFTPALIERWIRYKREREVDAVRLRPHPMEFYLYLDV